MKRMHDEQELLKLIDEHGGLKEVKIEDINSGEETAGKTILSDGDGGAEWGAVQAPLKKFTNVSASSWVSDSTYTGFDYKCELTCQGITADSVVMVIFGFTETMSGDYAPICETGENKVTIYSKVNTSITIPVIKEI